MLQDRILGKQGHLSNADCAALISHLHHQNLKHAYLAHLSKECNADIVALQTVQKLLESKQQQLSLSIAHQDQISQTVLF
jgi:phosphoribosyl 1,2-cyclic phosphodiesterase